MTLLPLAAALACTALAAEPTEFSTTASDGVVVFGDIYECEDGHGAPLILLFHQGGANGRGEYSDYIAPRLVEEGFNVISIDQRAGGDRFESENRTINALRSDVEHAYGDAYADLLAAVALAQTEGFTGDWFAWGSSYSAALVLKLATEMPERFAGVLAFSPASGSAMGEWSATNVIGSARTPVFAALPKNEYQMPQKAEFLEAAAESDVYVHVQEYGVHGSSMLHPDRASGGTEEMWSKVLAFLRNPELAEE